MLYPSGAAYARTLSELAVSSGINISRLDPNGGWDESSADVLALLEHDDEWGAGTFTLIETAFQEDVSKADGNWSMEDLEAACNPEVVEALLRRAAAESGEPIDEAQLAARVDEITTVAWLVRARAVGNDDWENIDDDVEWHERGIPRIFRDYVAAPLAQALVTGGCWAAAGLTAPETGGATLVAGAAGCTVIGGMAGRGVQSATHGGDIDDILFAATDADAMLLDAEFGAATGIVSALIPNPAAPLPIGPGSTGPRPTSQMLMNQLEASGMNFTRANVVGIGRTGAGNIIWLETGTAESGLQHIVVRHGAQFARLGVDPSDVPEVVMRAVTDGRVVGYQGAGVGRPIFEVTVNGEPMRIAVTVGNNGYIVGANPRS